MDEFCAELLLRYRGILFYFRNDRAAAEQTCEPCDVECHSCIAGDCAEQTISNFTGPVGTGEADVMARLLPPGRKLQVGVYFSGLSGCGVPSIKYGHDVLELVLSHPSVNGATVYTEHPLVSTDGEISCPTPLAHKFCAVASVFGSF